MVSRQTGFSRLFKLVNNDDELGPRMSDVSCARESSGVDGVLNFGISN